MSTHARLRPEQEALLLSALEKTAEHIASGEEPNAALAKAASVLDVPEGHLPLLVYAYNTARTKEQLQSSDDPMEKSADFKLADLAGMRAIMYPEVKTPEQEKRAAAISTEYFFPPTWAKSAACAKAQAGGTLAIGDVPAPKRVPEITAEPLAALPEEQAKRKLEKRSRDERDVREAKVAQLMAEMDARRTIDELSAYFRKSGSESFTRVLDNVDALYGQDMLAVMKHLQANHPEFAKQAMTAAKPVDARQEPYKTMELALQKLKTAAAAVACTEEKTAAFAAAYPSVIAGNTNPSFFDSPEKRAGAGQVLGTALGISATREAIGQMANNLKGPDPETSVRKQMDRISSPDHELALRNIQLRTTLQELMATDPVIMAHDPHTVINTFNELSQLAPRIASQPSMLRSVLRKQLEQQHMEPFELGELAKIEQTLARPSLPSLSGGA